MSNIRRRFEKGGALPHSPCHSPSSRKAYQHDTDDDDTAATDLNVSLDTSVLSDIDIEQDDEKEKSKHIRPSQPMMNFSMLAKFALACSIASVSLLLASNISSSKKYAVHLMDTVPLLSLSKSANVVDRALPSPLGRAPTQRTHLKKYF